MQDFYNKNDNTVLKANKQDLNKHGRPKFKKI